MTPRDMLTNPSFCPMPWTGLMYNFDGKVKNCIRSAGPLGNIKDQPIDQILRENNRPRQQQIIDQQPVPTCHTCYDLERGKTGFDHISDRIFYIRELKKIPVDTYQIGRFDLQTIDVRWKIRPVAAAHQELQDFKNYIYDHAGQLKHVYLAGGEPLLMKENLTLLERLNPQANIRINTNLSKVDTRVFEAVCQFPNVHWTVSVETQADEFEYIRHGGSWQDFLDNLAVIQQLNHKISFNMLHFLLNYDSIFDCVDFLKDLNFHPNSFVIGALLDPEYLNIRHLPQNVLNCLKTKLQDRINQKPGYLLEDSYRNMLHYIDIPFEKNIQQSIDKISEMDQRRGLDSRAIFKNFYNAFLSVVM